jgi:excinuclease ABC subunit A
MGPEGGESGGNIVAQGTPGDIAGNPASHRRPFLAVVPARRPVKLAPDKADAKAGAKPKRSRAPKAVRQAAE